MLAYLAKRRAQISSASFRAAGFPIGDGIVESANKLVVEQRLKGSRVPAGGCHWARSKVNPMVALRAAACSDRWEAGWTRISERLRQQEREQRRARQQAHHPWNAR